MAQLPAALVATAEEVLGFVEDAHLHGRGLGYVDVHLLASSRLSGDARLWTRDWRLNAAAEDLGLAAPPV